MSGSNPHRGRSRACSLSRSALGARDETLAREHCELLARLAESGAADTDDAGAGAAPLLASPRASLTLDFTAQSAKAAPLRARHERVPAAVGGAVVRRVTSTRERPRKRVVRQIA